MADLKISQLTAISVLTPATDVLPVVDVGGVTKKIQVNQILASNGVAALASATITGNLTVDTSTLFVNSSTDRVGIGTVTPLSNLHVGGGTGLNNLGVGLSRGATTNFYEAFDGTKSFLAGTDSSQTGVKVGSLSNHSMFLVCNNITQLQIDPLGVFSFTDGAGGTRMTLNSTGLGVGVVPANDKLLSLGSIGILLSGATSDFSFRNSGGTAIQRMRYTDATGALTIGSASTISYPVELGGNTTTRAVTIDASGNLLVGITTTSGNAGGLKLSNVSGNRGEITFSNNSGASDYVARFNYGSTPTLVGNITVSSGGTSFVTTSDYRLKESVVPLSGGLARVNSLKPSIYKWKADGSNGEGFIAHELAEVVPLAVTGVKDAVNEDGTVNPQGVDLSKVVPILVAAIQELTARVQTLETR